MYVYGWIAWGWEAHFRNYRHYVSQCPVSTLDWLPNFPHKAWVDSGEGSLTFRESLWVGIEVHDHYSWAKRVFLQLNWCKNLYHQSRRKNMKITVNIKVIKSHNENLLNFLLLISRLIIMSSRLFHTLNTKTMMSFSVNFKAPSTFS